MALPALTKTWVHRLNQSQAGGVTPTFQMSQARATLLLDFKDTLVGWGNVTVPRSCDGVSAANSDLWTDISDIITNNTGTPFSWIVLRFAGGYDVLLSLLSTSSFSPWDGSSLSVYMAPTSLGGFTGGSPTANPTAPGSIMAHINVGTNYSGGNIPDPNLVWHIQQSTDGLNTRMRVYQAGVSVGYLAFERPIGDTQPGDYPDFCIINPEAGCTRFNNGTYSLHTSAAANFYKISDAQIRETHNLMGERSAAGPIVTEVTAANPVDGTELFLPIDVCRALDSQQSRQYRGRLPDIYWVRDGLAEATMFPTSAPYTWATSGNLVLPWDPAVGTMITT